MTFSVMRYLPLVAGDPQPRAPYALNIQWGMRSARWNEDLQGLLLLLGEIAVLRMQRNENEPS
jgi:hypothetical protein